MKVMAYLCLYCIRYGPLFPTGREWGVSGVEKINFLTVSESVGGRGFFVPRDKKRMCKELPTNDALRGASVMKKLIR